ncbi:MgtC/SapB family protein [Halobaculum sp. EA56]|uniref:MgtC/SapB family protein n=1 Tax=Halobaculum sp. EA56 TaxID=3421648 RepID=UPI003EBB3E07
MVVTGAEGMATDPLSVPVVRLALAAALGLFLGLEREWSDKSAGIRTFSLTSLVGAVFTLLASETAVGEALLAVGGVLVVVQGVLLAVRGLREGGDGSLSLTTAVSLLAAYGVGALVAAGYVVEGVTVAVVSSALLVLKRELHSFAGDLSRTELRSMTEFAILAFVVYPVLPAGERVVFGVPLEPRVAWLMVVTVAGIGMVNYALVRTYGGRGIAVTGFFGGLASSTAVVGTMLDHATDRAESVSYAVAGVLLADAAMALRNLAIAVAFTAAGDAPVLVGVVAPLGALAVGAVAVAAATADWRAEVDLALDSPFSLRNALAFGAAFLLILAVSSVAQIRFGTAGLYASAAASGLVSSAGATTSAVLLYRGGTVGAEAATVAVLLATVSSVAVKAALAVAGPRAFVRRVAAYSLALVAVSGVVAAAATML